VVRLKEVAPPPSEEIAGYETKDQAAKVSLPRYVREKGEYEEPPDYCCPKGKGNGYGEDKYPQLGPHHSQYSAQGKDGSRSPNSYQKRWRQKYEQNITQYTSAKIGEQESTLSNQYQQVSAKEVKGQHVGQDMPQAAVDK